MDSRDQSATEAAAAAIDAHTPTGYDGNVDCWCGQNFDSWAEHATHLAGAVLQALEESGFTVARLRQGYDPARDCLVIEVPGVVFDEDGDPLCSECRRPQPREWCWFASKTCPLAMPPRYPLAGGDA